MENFFYDDKFFSDLGELCDHLDLTDDEAIGLLPDDWYIEVNESILEPITELSAEWILERIDEERWPEDDDSVYKKVKLLLNSLEYATINEAMPKLYYESSRKSQINKSDLLG